MVYICHAAPCWLSGLRAATGIEKEMTKANVNRASLGRFRYIVAAAAVATFLLIVIGGIVRVTGSGLGCPDWPTCFGRFIPPNDIKAQIEYSHRFWASAIT